MHKILFQAQWRWKGGHPLSFQPFRLSSEQDLNWTIKRKSVVLQYDCLQRMTNYMVPYVHKYKHFSKCTRIPFQKITYSFHPHQVIKKTCTSMLLSNLAEPEWVFITCNESLLNVVVCVKDKNVENNNSYTLNIVKKNNICLKQYLKINEKCYKLSWISRNSRIPLRDICEKYEKQVNQRSVLEKTLNLVSQKGQFPPILALYSHGSKMKISKLTYKKFLGQLYFSSEFISSFEAEGFFLCNVKPFTVIIGSNLFPCNAGGYISYEYICDGLIDCPNDISDEKNIFCVKYGIEEKILNSEEHNISHKCSNLYLLTIYGTCQKYSSLGVTLNQLFITKLTINIYRNLNYFNCKNGTPIHLGIFNDTIANCGLYSVNKSPFSSQYYHKNKTLTLCNKPHEIPCQDKSSKCFQLQDTCLYSINSDGTLSFCRNGGHLDNCVYYECDTMFKCQSSYCIPWSYICDGKWDCPHGIDETFKYVCTSNETCLAMYKCFKFSRKCLHIQNVCDGHADCPYGDDESSCELDRIRCPPQCTCLLLAIECVNRSTKLDLNHPNFPHISVYISNTIMNSLQFIFHKFNTCLLFKAPRNNLKHICSLSSNKMLFYLSLNHNLIDNIAKNCFAGLLVLRHLRLDNNCIVVISFGSFNNLSHLQSLNVSNNPLVKIPNAMLKHTSQFEMLYALNTIPKDFSINSLRCSSLKLIVSSDYHYCCIAPLSAICLPSKPYYFSCNDLLPNAKLNILFIAGAILVILPNTLSIALNILISKTDKKTQTPFTRIVIAINLTDALCGIVLLIIWIVDKKFKGVFLLKEESWRSSSLCFVIFGTVVWFTLLSQLNLILLSLSRLNVVLYPMTSKFKDMQFVSKILYSVFIFTFVTSLMVTLFTKFIHEKMPLSLCLPFLDPTGSCLTIKVITWCTVFTESFTSVVIIIMHFLLMIKVNESDKNITRSSQFSNISLIIQLVIITLSNIICWFPANAIFVSVMFLSRYPSELVMLTTVIGIPVNSIINPSVFLIISLKKYLKDYLKTIRSTV